MAAKMCNVCGKRRPQTGSGLGVDESGDSTLCNYCYTEGGWENEHEDNGHDKEAVDGYAPSDCWICYPELNLAQKPKRAKAASKNAGFTRRPQLNHKGHSHPQTPAARRACKAAFWAVVAEAGVKKEDTVSMMMGKWDIKLDGHGKLVGPANMQPKAASWSVVPLGPKGGVVNQLKKGNPTK